MRKQWTILLLFCLILGGMAGCAAKETPATEKEETAVPLIDEGITVNGTIIEAANKRVDLAERNEYVQSIASCHWLEGNKIAIEGRLDGVNSQALYLAVYDVVRDVYVYEQYGKQFIWQNDDLDTLVYVVDYADANESSRVLNKQDVVLYETGSQEQVTNVSYVPKGVKVEVADLHGEVLRQVVVEVAN